MDDGASTERRGNEDQELKSLVWGKRKCRAVQVGGREGASEVIQEKKGKGPADKGGKKVPARHSFWHDTKGHVTEVTPSTAKKKKILTENAHKGEGIDTLYGKRETSSASMKGDMNSNRNEKMCPIRAVQRKKKENR